MDVKVGSDNSLQIAQLEEADFRVSASDTNGHSVRVQYRSQPGILQQIARIISSKKFPLKDASEFHRLADALLLKALENLRSGIPSIMATVDAVNAIIMEEEYYQDFLTLFEKLNKRVAEHMGRGAKGEAVRLVLKVTEKLRAMPEGYWKDQYTKELTMRWGGLIEEAGQVNLSQMLGEE
ncbi:MAG: hypothetical protein EHM41_00125 [Chloroflexi bacterium]|nr:MAG: hypothetical protein EHM41_00125 [Chloroflexota bacterium]